MYHFKNKEFKIAKTSIEFEAIYQFRYKVYIEHMGRDKHIADHENKMLKYPGDESSTTDIFYLGSVDNIKGTMRMDYWQASQVPNELAELNPKLFNLQDDDIISYSSKLMVEPKLRGLLQVPTLVGDGFGYIMSEKKVKRCFAICNSGLVGWYKQFGWKAYERAVSPSGFAALLMTISDDNMQAYIKKNTSILGLINHKIFKKQDKNINLNEEIIITDKNIVFDRVSKIYTMHNNDFLNDLSYKTMKVICSHAFLMHVKPDSEIARVGLVEKEIYIILKGRFNVALEDHKEIPIKSGAIFGEVAFFLDSGKRTASIKSCEESTVLVLRKSAIAKIAKKNPMAAYEITHKLGEVMAHRFEYLVKLKTKNKQVFI